MASVKTDCGQTAESAVSGRQQDNGRTIGEIRLSFVWFFLIIKWGKEKRGSERLQAERDEHPVLKRAHFPVLVTLWAMVFFAAYAILTLSLRGMALAFS